jgi:hypothetical protein
MIIMKTFHLHNWTIIINISFWSCFFWLMWLFFHAAIFSIMSFRKTVKNNIQLAADNCSCSNIFLLPTELEETSCCWYLESRTENHYPYSSVVFFYYFELKHWLRIVEIPPPKVVVIFSDSCIAWQKTWLCSRIAVFSQEIGISFVLMSWSGIIFQHVRY